MTRFLRDWGAALVWAALLFALSSRSTLPAPLPPIPHADRLAHFGAYTVLGLLLARGQHRAGISAAWPVFLGVAFGVSDEFHQSLVPGRAPSVGDWVADALGTLTGVFAYHSWRSRAELRRGAEPPSND